jgi:hypothetical protein
MPPVRTVESGSGVEPSRDEEKPNTTPSSATWNTMVCSISTPSEPVPCEAREVTTYSPGGGSTELG